jgi:hypothetical protein
MFTKLRILKCNRFKGVITSDHTPQMSCRSLFATSTTGNNGE